MPIRAILWDLGGVLIRTEDRAPRDQLAARLGFTRKALNDLVFGSDGDYRAQLGQITREQHWENVRQTLGVSVEEIERIREEFFAGDRLDNRLIEYIRGLRPRYRIGLLSNALSDLRRLLQDEWNIADLFDEMTISAEVGLMKPDLAIYRHALKQLECEPEEVIFVDDLEENILAARNLRLHGVLFQNAEQVVSELNAFLRADPKGFENPSGLTTKP